MAQADQTVQNATFPTVRADINNNLAALFTDSSGATAPTVTVAFQDWIDTSGANPLWKKRNAANNAWITVATITGSAIAFEGTLPSQTGNAGEYLTTDGTVASWASITAAGQLLRAPQVLTSGTTYTTPANCTSIYVEAIGGGGGGGGTNNAGAGGGGGAGGYCAKYFTVVAAVSYTYAIGAGGAANSAGGSTTFTVGGTTITAGGGAGGLTESNGGAGGTCTNGDMNIAGGGGGSGNTGRPGGAGGNSFFGGGAQGRFDGNGFAGTSGGGGSGGSSGTITGRTGGAGGAGLIRIWEFS
jgi:hypothetical protein